MVLIHERRPRPSRMHAFLTVSICSGGGRVAWGASSRDRDLEGGGRLGLPDPGALNGGHRVEVRAWCGGDKAG